MDKAKTVTNLTIDRNPETIEKVLQPQNKIIERLKNRMKYTTEFDPRNGYSRMHNRHNRS